MLRTLKSTAVGLTLLPLVALCLGTAPPPCDAAEATPDPVKVVLLNYLSFAPLFIAEEEGFYRQENLAVEFVKLERSAASIPALAKGEIDVVGGAAGVSLLNAILRGATIKAVADKGYIPAEGCDYNQLMAATALAPKLTGPADLKGRKISFLPLSMSEYYMEKILALGGLTLDDVECVNLGNPVKLDALANGALDLATAVEPWVVQMRRAGAAVSWMPSSRVIGDFQSGLVLYGPTLLEERREVGLRFMRAYLKAVAVYNQGKTPRNLEIMARFTELDTDLLKEVCWTPFRDDGHINLDSIRGFQEWAVGKGYQDGVVADAEFWDPWFVDQAARPGRTTP